MLKGYTKAAEMRGTLEQRIESVMQVTVGREMNQLQRHMGFLASLGTNVVIIGLFGTIFSIMNSFENIASIKKHHLGRCCSWNC